ncbi:MAG: spore germination protein, partial [Syntrophomonas sp.]
MRIFGKKKPAPEQTPKKNENQPLSPSLQENLKELRSVMQGCSDAVFKEFKFGHPATRGAIIFFDGLVDKHEVEINILKPLLLELNMQNNDSGEFKHQNIINRIMDDILTITELKKAEGFEELYHHIASGDTVILIDGYPAGLAASTRAWQGRPIQTPENEVMVFGPKEGFCETLRFNTAMLRRRIKSSRFKMESFVLGNIT